MSVPSSLPDTTYWPWGSKAALRTSAACPRSASASCVGKGCRSRGAGRRGTRSSALMVSRILMARGARYRSRQRRKRSRTKRGKAGTARSEACARGSKVYLRFQGVSSSRSHSARSRASSRYSAGGL